MSEKKNLCKLKIPRSALPINKTMFAKAESPSYHRKQCVNRECDRCGVDKLDLLNGEKDVRSNVPLETWQTT